MIVSSVVGRMPNSLFPPKIPNWNITRFYSDNQVSLNVYAFNTDGEPDGSLSELTINGMCLSRNSPADAYTIILV